MANRLKFIGQASATVLGQTLVINTNGIKDPKFVCRNLHVRHEVTISAVTSGDMSALNVGQATHEWIWRKTNRPFLNNIRGAALDLWAQSQRRPGAISYYAFADQVAAITNPHIFDIQVPLERPLAARPKDYRVSLDEIGALTVQLPSVLTGGNLLGATLSDWTVKVYAEGEDAQPGVYHAGVLARIDELTSDSGNDVSFKAYGNKVRSLLEYTTDTSGSPITGEDQPRIEFDGVQKYDYRGLNGGDAAYYAGFGWGEGSAGYPTFYDAGATPQQDTLTAPWIYPDRQQKITCMDAVDTIEMRFSSRLSDTTEARFILETLWPDQSGTVLRDRIPGGESMANPNDVAFRPGVAGSAEGAPMADKAFLPVNVAI